LIHGRWFAYVVADLWNVVADSDYVVADSWSLILGDWFGGLVADSEFSRVYIYMQAF